jgi:hypothetical protein
VIRTSTSPAVFVDDAGRRRRYMVTLGRAALAALAVTTAAMVAALLTGAPLPLLGLPDGVAAPAERAIRTLSDLPRPAAGPPAERRPEHDDPPPVPSTPGSPAGDAPGPADAAIAGPTTEGSRRAGNGETATGGGHPVTTPAPEPVRSGRRASPGQPATPGGTPAKAQGRTPAKTAAKPAPTAKRPAPAKSSRRAAASKPGRSARDESRAGAAAAAWPTDARRNGGPAPRSAARPRPTAAGPGKSPAAATHSPAPEAGTRPAPGRSATRPAAGQDPSRRIAAGPDPSRRVPARAWAADG